MKIKTLRDQEERGFDRILSRWNPFTSGDEGRDDSKNRADHRPTILKERQGEMEKTGGKAISSFKWLWMVGSVSVFQF